MFAAGANTVDIAKAAGISLRMCYQDLDLIREAYVEDFEGSMSSIRAELAAKHRAIYHNAINDYRKGAGIKALELASKELECLGRLHGVANGVSINMHNHEHQLTITSQAVGDLFKPLDAGSYAEMVASKALPPSEAKELPDVAAEAESAGTDQWVSGDAVPVEVIEPTDQPKAKKAARPYPFRT
ncbi:hypothetical protein OAK25_00625 [Synechococcus sp. AH-551-P10]|nr:hypothetical protein [Synechococcus sp. AH-551-P10]